MYFICIYIYVCLCGKDHIHHIPYLFCLSHISITFINKTNPSNSLKRKNIENTVMGHLLYMPVILAIVIGLICTVNSC